MKILQVTEEEYANLLSYLQTNECHDKDLLEKLEDQGEDQDSASGYEPLEDPYGHDEPDLNTALWSTFNYADLLSAPADIGYGSGEEVWSFLQEEQGFTQLEATTLVDLINKISPTE
jgi:hypothetical protein